MSEPVFLLAPGRSFTSVLCAMLGQHPKMYGLPETNLPMADTVGEWMSRTGMSLQLQVFRHGLLRALAQLGAGVQNTETINRARLWLRANSAMTTEALFHMIEDSVAPRRLVEKSPLATFDDSCLARLARFAPDARYIHVTRHPYSYGRSTMETDFFREMVKYGASSLDRRVSPPVPDPQVQWYNTNQRILAFLATLPRGRWIHVRGEDLLADPRGGLPRLCRWLGIDDGPEAIKAMMHPEASPFSKFGPPNAMIGNDPGFLQDAKLRPYKAKPLPLSGPLPWREDGVGFADEVVRLAEAFGYTDSAAAGRDAPPVERPQRPASDAAPAAAAS